MNQEIQDLISKHAEECYPQECCGLLYGPGLNYYPCQNTATTPSEHFRIAAEEWAEVEELGPIVGVVHSHPDYPPHPSEADRVQCEFTQVPWYIQEVISGVSARMLRVDPTGYKAPLLERPFFHGVLDCLSLVQDYYLRECGIDVGQYDREDGWWDAGKDYYRELLPKAGFRQVSDLRDGDLVLMQIRSPVPNHAAIYLESGTLLTEDCYPQPGCILHHLYGKLSRRDNYGGYWADVTVGYWRHHAKG